MHTVEVTTGFRQATFTADGLVLNGERLLIFGLNCSPTPEWRHPNDYRPATPS
ncbi:MAG: hypothetical protein ACR2NR_00355 [Solirubrobacteraceae bacterium]